MLDKNNVDTSMLYIAAIGKIFIYTIFIIAICNFILSGNKFTQFINFINNKQCFDSTV